MLDPVITVNAPAKSWQWTVVRPSTQHSTCDGPARRDEHVEGGLAEGRREVLRREGVGVGEPVGELGDVHPAVELGALEGLRRDDGEGNGGAADAAPGVVDGGAELVEGLHRAHGTATRARRGRFG